MTESEFLQFSDDLFGAIESALDHVSSSVELDVHLEGNVLTVESDTGDQVIINRHVPTQELWIAAKSGGYHFALKEGVWQDTRSSEIFSAALSRVLATTFGVMEVLDLACETV